MDGCQTCLTEAALEVVYVSPVIVQAYDVHECLHACMFSRVCGSRSADEEQTHEAKDGGSEGIALPCLSLNSSFICLINLCDGML